MGQPGKVQTTLLTPVDVVKAEWLSKSSNRSPEMLAAKPPKPKIIEIAKDLPEYIIDPGTKTTYLKGKFLGKNGLTSCFPALITAASSVLSSLVSHWVSRKDLMSLDTLRKITTGLRSLMGVASSLAGLGSFFVPVVTGLLTTHKTLSEWQIVFWINFGVLGSSGLVYILFGSAEAQPWNYPTETTREERRDADKNLNQPREMKEKIEMHEI